MATQADFDRLANWALMKNPDADIDRRKCHRVVPMEVLSLGFSRTGTLTIQEALSVLGYPNPYHYSSIFANVQDTDMWTEALRAKFKLHDERFDYKQHFDRLLGHSGAVTDTPAVCFWKELVEAYPDAKVILVERDEDKWYPSCEVLLDGVLDPFGRYVLRFTDPAWFGRIINCGMLWIEGFFGSTDPKQAKRNARAAYRAHYAGIRAMVPKDRLLEFDLGSGWEPLCEFLGKDVPKVQFPHRNETKTIQLAFGDLAAKAVTHSLLNIAIVVGAAATIGGVVWSFSGLAG